MTKRQAIRINLIGAAQSFGFEVGDIDVRRSHIIIHLPNVRSRSRRLNDLERAVRRDIGALVYGDRATGFRMVYWY